MSTDYWTQEAPNPEAHETAQPTTAQPAKPTQAEVEAALAQLETWKDDAIKRFPGAARLRDYLVANTRAEVMELAGDLADKLGTAQPAPSPSVGAGSPALSQGDDNSELGVAREALRRSPNSNKAQSDWLRAKHHEAGMAYIDE